MSGAFATVRDNLLLCHWLVFGCLAISIVLTGSMSRKWHSAGEPDAYYTLTLTLPIIS